jgi:hypothetical protein
MVINIDTVPLLVKHKDLWQGRKMKLSYSSLGRQAEKTSPESYLGPLTSRRCKPLGTERHKCSLVSGKKSAILLCSRDPKMISQSVVMDWEAGGMGRNYCNMGEEGGVRAK